MIDSKRQPPRFVPTLTEVVPAPRAPNPALPATEPLLSEAVVASKPPETLAIEALTQRLTEQVLTAAHGALQAEIDRFAQLAHASLETRLQQVMQETLQNNRNNPGNRVV